ncbi:hypothetical protein CORC01_09543, partial [Colletotrichum orchidophilum]
PHRVALLLVRASRAVQKYRAKVDLERRSRVLRVLYRRPLAEMFRVAQLCNQTVPCRYPGASERERGKYLRVMDSTGADQDPNTTCMFRRWVDQLNPFAH